MTTAQASAPGKGSRRPTSWWLAMLRRRAERMYEEKLDLSEPIRFASTVERDAAVAFFNAAFRAEESGLSQAHALASEVAAWDPELAECLRLYGDEEGWHRHLLTQFLAYLGGEIRPMGRVTGTFYRAYGKAERVETIVLTNLMFETIGSTTYRLALRRATHPAVRQMLTILTRDESFHVPLNVHFLREALRMGGPESPPKPPELGLMRWLKHSGSRGTVDRLQLQAIYHLLFVTLLASAAASRRKAQAFDNIPFRELSTAYAEHLARLFLHEPDLRFTPSSTLLRLFGLDRDALAAADDLSAVSLEAAERAVDRERVTVSAL
jgi:Ferritin-like domain